MAGETVDLIFTDPPYNVDYEDYTEDRLKIRQHQCRVCSKPRWRLLVP
jgi:DNA modification methylase